MLSLSLALLLSVVAFDDDPAAKQVDLKKGDRIIFFGDSLTELAIKDKNVPEGKGYVPLVREALKDKGVEVDAVATGGHRVPNLLARVDRDVLSRKPTIVVIQIGVNDAGSGVTPEKFKTQLEELIDRLHKGGARGSAAPAPAGWKATGPTTPPTRSSTPSPRSPAPSPGRRSSPSTTCARRSSATGRSTTRTTRPGDS